MLHPFYTLDTPTPLVAGYDLNRAAKLVNDSVPECIWTYWFIDSSEPHKQDPVPNSANSVHTLTAPPPTTLIRPADQWLDDCLNLVGIDTATVGYDSTLQRPNAPPSFDSYVSGPSAPVFCSGPSAPISFSGPSAPVPCSGPSALESCSGPCAFVSCSGPCAPVLCRGPGAHISYQSPCSPPFQSSNNQSAPQNHRFANSLPPQVLTQASRSMRLPHLFLHTRQILSFPRYQNTSAYFPLLPSKTTISLNPSLPISKTFSLNTPTHLQQVQPT